MRLGKAITAAITAHAAIVDAHHTPAAITTGRTPSDTLRNSNDTERTTGSTSYVKVKEILLNADLDAVRVNFDLKSGGTGGYDVKGRVYKNGSPIGTERTTTSNSYTTYPEDFTGFVSGDLIQIYACTPGGERDPYVQNFRLCYDHAVVGMEGHTLQAALATDTDPTISTTNQDP